MLSRAYVEITNVCNLRCSFCPGTARPPRFMSVEEFERVADRLRGHTGYLYFHLMGEPLLHPHLPALLQAAGDRDFRVCLTTNGTLLPKVGTALLSAPALHKVSVSLHSFEGNDGADGALRDYLEGVWQFASAAAEQGILCALRLWNAGGREEKNRAIGAFLSEKLQKDVADIPADSRGSRTLRPNLFLERAEKFDWPEAGGALRETEFCLGLRRQIGVLCDGTVVPCCLDSEGTLALGNLLQDDWDTVCQGERARRIYEGFSRREPAEELCRRCGYARRFNRKG